jgi:putative membrane protein
MKHQLVGFIVRWAFNAIALWLTISFMNPSYLSSDISGATFMLAGLILSLVNSMIKPIIVVLSLPAILLSLGLFMLIVNGLMVYITFKLVPNLQINFSGAIMVGLILSVLNWLFSGILDNSKIYPERKAW